MSTNNNKNGEIMKETDSETSDDIKKENNKSSENNNNSNNNTNVNVDDDTKDGAASTRGAYSMRVLSVEELRPIMSVFITQVDNN